MKRGLSIDTTLSNRSVMTGPPAYEEVDSNPSSAALGVETLGAVGSITPGRVGVAF